MCADDFQNAKARHFRDAEILERESKFANADHLLGIAAECGLKELLEALNMPQRDVHINSLWNIFNNMVDGRAHRNLILPRINVFANWNINQRYKNEAHFTEIILREHKNGYNIIEERINRAKRAGLIRH